MAQGDIFKRSLEAGTSFIGMSRERAESIVREWVEAGDMGRGRAQKAIEDLLDRSRKVTDDLRRLVRREVRNQVAALGVATRADLARLETKIDAVATRATAHRAAETSPAAPAPKARTAKKAPSARATTDSAAPGGSAAPSKRATAGKPGPRPRPTVATTDEAGAGEGGGAGAES
jgi:polyhydroxyalkanoate synthesis regulator phasin